MNRCFALALALALTTAALVPRALDAQAPAAYEIDVILPLSGYGAFLGKAQAETLAIAEREINDTGGIDGRRLHFAIVDSQSSPQVDLQLTGQVLAKHPSVVIEGGPATVCKAVATLYAHGPVVWCLSPAFFPERGGYAFSSGMESRVGMETTLDYLETAKLRRVALITVIDIAGQEADTALKALLAEPAHRDLTLVAAEHFGAQDVSVDAQMAKIKQAAPQVVIGWATGAPTGTLLRAFRDVGLSVPFVASSANQTYEQMQQYKDILPPDYLLYSTPWPEYPTLPPGPLKVGMAPYFRALGAAGAHPDGGTLLAWDSAMIIARTLRRLGPSATAQQVRDAVLTLHDYDGPSGHFDFRLGNQRGIGLGDCIMVRWDARTATWQAVSAPGGGALK